MKKPYFTLWAIIVLAFAGFLFLSVYNDEVHRLSIRTGSFAKSLWGTSTTAQEHTQARQVPTPKQPKKKAAVLDTTGKNILFIGDSMLEGLAPRLGAYCEANGHALNSVIWYSSTSEVWSGSGKLAQYIKQFKPNYIFVCLGSNELFVNDIKEKRRHMVKKILAEIGTIPYIWIGPPNWKPDTGINSLLQEEVAEGHYYLSFTPTQHYDRSKDGAHPTRSSASAWMDRVCHWVMTSSEAPIKLKVPTQARGAMHVVVLQPVD